MQLNLADDKINSKITIYHLKLLVNEKKVSTPKQADELDNELEVDADISKKKEIGMFNLLFYSFEINLN